MKDGEEDSVASPSTGEKGGTGKEGEEDQEVKRGITVTVTPVADSEACFSQALFKTQSLVQRFLPIVAQNVQPPIETNYNFLVLSIVICTLSCIITESHRPNFDFIGR